MHMKLCLRLALMSLFALAACSGDDDNPAPNDAGTKDRADASAADSGKGKTAGSEGWECKDHDECASGLRCLRADERIEDLKVCARPCKGAGECEDNERCLTLSKDAEDLMCWNTEGEAFGLCGPAYTALCDESKNLGCLRVEDEQGSIAAGVCLSPCELGKEDQCEEGLSCLDILESEDMGLCARATERGEICDEPNGTFCEPGNLCLKDSEWRCYQDCTESRECDDDKECRDLENDPAGAAYCE